MYVALWVEVVQDGVAALLVVREGIGCTLLDFEAALGVEVRADLGQMVECHVHLDGDTLLR